MHFRERGQMVQLIRTTYDPKTKKGTNQIVGRLTKANPKVTEAVESALTPQERKQLSAWLAGHATLQRLRRELAVRSLTEHMDMAGEWFEQQKGEDAKALAANLIPAWNRLRSVLKRNGLAE